MRLSDIQTLLELVKIKSLADTQQLKEANLSRENEHSHAARLQTQALGLSPTAAERQGLPLSAYDLQQTEKFREHLLDNSKRKLQNAAALDPLIAHLQDKMRTSLRSETALKSVETEHLNEIKRRSENQEENSREHLNTLKRMRSA